MTSLIVPSTWHLYIEPLFSFVTSSCTCCMTLGRQSEPFLTIFAGRFSMTSNFELSGVEMSHVRLAGGRPAKTSHSSSQVLFSSTITTSLWITGFSGLAARGRTYRTHPYCEMIYDIFSKITASLVLNNKFLFQDVSLFR